MTCRMRYSVAWPVPSLDPVGIWKSFLHFLITASVLAALAEPVRRIVQRGRMRRACEKGPGHMLCSERDWPTFWVCYRGRKRSSAVHNLEENPL